jgi:peptidoglycan/xylan/chitin deacetylase (PgdA/CDA1 family)
MPGDTLVLCYHAVSPTWPSELAVKPEDLRRQVESVLAEGYRARNFSEAVLAPEGDRTVVLTFDDAFKSVFDHARPVLAELGVPATLYVPTDFPGSGVPFPLPGAAWIGTEHESELTCMDWDEIRRLRDEGWEIGAHTCSHPWLTQASDERLASELTRSAEICAERLRQPCRSLAYPYGDHDDRVVAAAAAAGYEAACTVPHRFEPFESSPLRYARIDVTRTESPRAFKLRTARGSRRARASAAARPARWLDTHRPRRSTVLAALRRRRHQIAVARALRERCTNWSEALGGQLKGSPLPRLDFRGGAELRFERPSPENLDRFGEVFVTQPYTRHVEIPAGGLVLEVGPGDGLFSVFALERGCERVLGAAAGSPDLDALTASTEGETIDFLKLEVDGGAAALVAASDAALRRIGGLVCAYDPAADPRVDEVVDRLRRAGFETWLDLDLDPDSGAGYVSAKPTRR